MRSISSGNQRKTHFPFADFCGKDETTLAASTAHIASNLLRKTFSNPFSYEPLIQEKSVQQLNAEEFSLLNNLLHPIFQGKTQDPVPSETRELEFFLHYQKLYHSRNQQVTAQFLDFVNNQGSANPLSKKEKKICQEAFLITSHPHSYLGDLGPEEKRLIHEAGLYSKGLYTLLTTLSKEATPTELLENFQQQQERYLSAYQDYHLIKKDKYLQHKISLYLKLKEILLTRRSTPIEFKALLQTQEMIQESIHLLGGRKALEQALEKNDHSLTQKALKNQRLAFQTHRYLLEGKVVDDASDSKKLRGDLEAIFKKKFAEKPLSPAFFYTFLYSSYNRLSTIPQSKHFAERYQKMATSFASKKKEGTLCVKEASKELNILLNEVKIYDYRSKENYDKYKLQVSEGTFYETSMFIFDRVERLKKRREMENSNLLFPFLKEIEIQNERNSFDELYSLNNLPNFKSWMKKYPFREDQWKYLHATNGGEYLQRQLFLPLLSSPNPPSLLSLPETLQLDYPLIKEMHQKTQLLKQKLQVKNLLEQHVKKLTLEEIADLDRELESYHKRQPMGTKALKEVLQNFSKRHDKRFSEEVLKQLDNSQALLNQAFDKLMHEQFEYYLVEGRHCSRVEKSCQAHLKAFEDLSQEVSNLYTLHQQIYQEHYQFLAEKLLFERALQDLVEHPLDTSLPPYLERSAKLFYPLEKKLEKSSFLMGAFIFAQENKKQQSYLQKQAKIEKSLKDFSSSVTPFQNLSQYLKELFNHIKKLLTKLKLPHAKQTERLLEKKLQETARQLSAQRLLDSSVFEHLNKTKPPSTDYDQRAIQKLHQTTLRTLIGKNIAFESSSSFIDNAHSKMLKVKNAQNHTLMDIVQIPEYTLEDLKSHFVKAHQSCFKNSKEIQNLQKVLAGESLSPLIILQKKQLAKEILNRHKDPESPSFYGSKNPLKGVIQKLFQDAEGFFSKIKHSAKVQHDLSRKLALPSLKTG